MNKEQAVDLWIEVENTHWTPDKVSDIQERANQISIDKCKELTGKKKSDPIKAWNYVVNNVENGKEILTDLMKPLHEEVNIRYAEFNKSLENKKNQLKEFAKTYTPEKSDGMNCLKVSYHSDYRSQGWGASKYAKNYLMDDFKLLKILGYDAEVRAVPKDEHNWDDSWQLWANMNKFNYEMLKMSGKFISVLNWAILCWQEGSNPKVYFPFLSNEDYEKSQYLAYHTNYEVNIENMMLELSWDEIEKLYPRKS